MQGERSVFTLSCSFMHGTTFNVVPECPTSDVYGTSCAIACAHCDPDVRVAAVDCSTIPER